MHRPDRRSASVPTLMVLLLTGCAGGAAVSSSGYQHEYSETGGDGLRFELETGMIMTMEQPMPMDVDILSTARLTLTLERAGEGWEADLTIDEFDMSGSGMEQIGMAGLGDLQGLLDLEGKSETFPLDAAGRLETSFDLESLTSGASLGGLQNYAQQMFIVWPEGPIEAGAVWTDSLRVESEEEMSLAMLQVYRYEYLGMISSEIDGETIEGHAVRKVTETVVSGGADMEGMSLDMTATGKGSGTLYFDQRRGMLLHASSEDELSMEMTMVGPITMTIPMEMSYTTVVRRLP